MRAASGCVGARCSSGPRRAARWSLGNCALPSPSKVSEQETPNSALDQGLQPLRGHSRGSARNLPASSFRPGIRATVPSYLRREHHQGGARAGGRPRSREERRRGEAWTPLTRDQRRGRRQGLQLRAGQYLAGGGLHPRRPRPRLHEGLFRQGDRTRLHPSPSRPEAPPGQGHVRHGPRLHARYREAHRHGVELPEGQDADGARQWLPPRRGRGAFPCGTGLIGTPKANDKGIEIKCLLNPRLRIGGRVRLDNAGGAGLKAGAGREPRTSTTASTASFR